MMFPSVSGVNISNTWRPLILFPSLFRLNSPPNPFSTSVSVSSFSKSIDDDQHFLPWLNQKSGTLISTSLSIRNSNYGRGLFATQNILAGDCLLKVPFTVQLRADNLPLEIRSLLGDDIGNVAKVAVLILHEQRLGQNSQWAPYISRLPLLEDMHSTIFWSSDELEMIRPSALYKETLKQKSQIEKDFQAVKLASDRFPNFHGITAEEFKYAFGLVTSRAWESSSGVSLIPFADLINHDCMSESYVLGDNSNQYSEVIADCDYAPGDQVMISYGKLSNATLLLDFGFTLSHNIYDQVQVELNIPQTDGLHEQKLELLKRYQTIPLQDINKFTSSWNYFTIKEVRTSSRNGKGIPQSLRAFCRILSSNSHKELNKLVNEASQGDGRLARYPLKNKNREIKAHQLLLSEISHLIEEHSAHIKLLDTKLSHLCEKNSLLRRRFAKDLLAGELRVLKSAQTWLKNYCMTLSWN